jgi:hypothetical protein
VAQKGSVGFIARSMVLARCDLFVGAPLRRHSVRLPVFRLPGKLCVLQEVFSLGD